MNARACSDRFELVLAPINAVTRGLDPRVHHLAKSFIAKRMDCRVKPGNDSKLDRSDRN
jgi:hypothetical protein